jgi:hypothetical protein
LALGGKISCGGWSSPALGLRHPAGSPILSAASAVRWGRCDFRLRRIVSLFGCRIGIVLFSRRVCRLPQKVFQEAKHVYLVQAQRFICAW